MKKYGDFYSIKLVLRFGFSASSQPHLRATMQTFTIYGLDFCKGKNVVTPEPIFSFYGVIDESERNVGH